MRKNSPHVQEHQDTYENTFKPAKKHIQELRDGFLASEYIKVDDTQLHLPPIKQLYLDPNLPAVFKPDQTGMSELVGLVMNAYVVCMNSAVIRADIACRLATLHSSSNEASASLEQRNAQQDYEKALEIITFLETTRIRLTHDLDDLTNQATSQGKFEIRDFIQLCSQFYDVVMGTVAVYYRDLPSPSEISIDGQQVQSPEMMLEELGQSFSACLEQLHQIRNTTSDDKAAKNAFNDLPLRLSQPTFIEAREAGTAISDGRDLRNWQAIEGMIAMLHCPQNARLQTRFEPSTLLLSWWGNSQGADLKTLEDNLKRLDLEALVTFFVCLSWAIEEFQVTTSIDAIISAIGRGEDARRSSKERALWRAKIWHWLALFDSMAIVGARPGTWREPRDGDRKRAKIQTADLESHDALLKVMGYRKSEQGTFDESEPPKEVTLAAGPWINQWRGNREILSEFGNVRAIAAIPRGKPSGAWATCAGLLLQQRWREQAARTPIKKVKSKTAAKELMTQEFGPFTRRSLLLDTWRTDHDVSKVLESNNPHRAKEYWNDAIEILRKHGIVSHYQELEPLKTGYAWAEEWLDQPLDIRPCGETHKDALAISQAATQARKKNRKPNPVRAKTKESQE